METVMVQATRTAFFAAGLILIASSCATVQDPGQAGFLSDYSKLEEIDENHLVYGSGNLGNYSKFIIEPVAMLYRLPEEERIFTDEELEELQAYFETKVREALVKDDGYQVVKAAGPGTAKLRVAITGVDDTIGALNVLIYTKITGAGLGGASMEGELVDSMTGEQIAAVIRWGSGSRILRAGFTHTGDAKILMGRWAKDLRERTDKAHGR
jgi:hypothetical protein